MFADTGGECPEPDSCGLMREELERLARQEALVAPELPPTAEPINELAHQVGILARTILIPEDRIQRLEAGR